MAQLPNAWNLLTSRTSSKNAWSTFIRSFAEHSIKGIFNWRARLWASSLLIWMKHKEFNLYYMFIIIAYKVSKSRRNLFGLPLFGVPDRLCFPPTLSEIHRGLWPLVFVFESGTLHQRMSGLSLRTPAKSPHQISYTEKEKKKMAFKYEVAKLEDSTFTWFCTIDIEPVADLPVLSLHWTLLGLQCQVCQVLQLCCQWRIVWYKNLQLLDRNLSQNGSKIECKQECVETITKYKNTLSLIYVAEVKMNPFHYC